MNITPEYLRDAAVEAVKNYLKSKKPLTESVTEIALRDALTGEQIKRVVETVNQVSYLKLLESAEDRTFEFPLASYEDVMAKILSPQEILEQDAGESPLALMKQAMEEGSGDGLEKAASLEETVPEGDRINMLYRQYRAAEQELVKVASEERFMVDKLMGLAEKCKSDPEFMDKVAFVTDGDEAVCKKLSKLVFGQVKQASGQDLFYEEDLVDAHKLVGLLKEAEEMVEKKAQLGQQVTDSAKYLGNKAKKAVGYAAGTVKTLIPGKFDAALGALTYRPNNNILKSLHGRPTQ